MNRMGKGEKVLAVFYLFFFLLSYGTFGIVLEIFSRREQTPSLRTAVDGVDDSIISLDWSRVRAAPIISLEDETFEAGQTKIVKINPLIIPPKAAVLRSFYGSNGMGNMSCIGSTEFKSFKEERLADRAMFHSRIKANMVRGDLLGHVFVIPSQ